MMITTSLLIAHLLGDFYLGTEKGAACKGALVKPLLFHTTAYALCMALAFLFSTDILITWPALAVVVACNLIINVAIHHAQGRHDACQGRRTLAATRLRHFVIGQLINVCCIMGAMIIFRLHDHEAIIADHDELLVMRYILLFLTLIKPTSALIQMLFDYLLVDNPEASEEQSHLNAGRWIGYLERIIVATLIMNDQYGAVGLVLTAKSIARFKQMEDKDFAEKYLVGTLTSLATALLMTIAVKKIC